MTDTKTDIVENETQENAYAKPELIELGDITEQTLAGVGAGADGGYS